MRQPGGRRRDEEAKLIGLEGAATEAVGKAACLELLDPLFGLTAIDGDVVHDPPGIGMSGHDKAGVEPFGGCLRLVYHPPLFPQLSAASVPSLQRRT